MIAVALVGLNYGHLADQSASLMACLLLLGVFVGVGEELMFRGIGVHAFQRAGLTESKVALYSSLVFGLVHVSDAFGQGAQALVQALVMSTSGYFFYPRLRVGGVILLPILVHGLWDTSLISNLVGDEPQASLGMVLVALLQVVLIVVLLVKRRTIETASPAIPNRLRHRPGYAAVEQGQQPMVRDLGRVPAGQWVRPWPAGPPAAPPSARFPPAVAAPTGSGSPPRAGTPRTPR